MWIDSSDILTTIALTVIGEAMVDGYERERELRAPFSYPGSNKSCVLLESTPSADTSRFDSRSLLMEYDR